MAVYACTDFHGMLHLYKAVKEKLEPGDVVYYLGDAGDRGPEPWETIKAVLQDPQFIYLKGNHEDMLCEALGEYIERGCPDFHAVTLLSYNGGRGTYQQATEDPQLEMWYQKLMRLDLLKEYTNTNGERVILSHAGFTPWMGESESDIVIPASEDLIWSREHFLDLWTEEDCVDCYIVHGHTPIPYLLDEIDPACTMGEVKPGALWYDDGRKCCIDCGAVFTGHCVLLNLDTWDEDIFCTDPYL